MMKVYFIAFKMILFVLIAFTAMPFAFMFGAGGFSSGVKAGMFNFINELYEIEFINESEKKELESKFRG